MQRPTRWPADRLAKAYDNQLNKLGNKQKPPIIPLVDQNIKDDWTRATDAIKMLAAGNGTGALACLAGMNYFAQRPDAHVFVKIGAITFLLGVISSVASYVALYVTVSEISTAIAYEKYYRQNEVEENLQYPTADNYAKILAFGTILTLAIPAALFLFMIGCGAALVFVVWFY